MHWKDITGSEILLEFRANLYHGCTLPDAIGILHSKNLYPSEYDNHSGISLTRSPNLWFGRGGKGYGAVVFVFNHDKIKNNFKIQPYDWIAHTEYNGTSGYTAREESEERIITTKPLPINNSYVKEIWLTKTLQDISTDNITSLTVQAIKRDVDRLLELANDLNIPVKYINKIVR